MYSRAANVYKRVSVESAPPARILDDLFARAIADCRDARARILRGDVAGKGAAISHALDIVGELAATLDFVAAPEMCRNLASLYTFISDRLTEGNRMVAAAPVAEAERILGTLREAFQGAAVQS